MARASRLGSRRKSSSQPDRAARSPCNTEGVSAETRVVLEIGTRMTFAVALDWPGWARRSRTADGALGALMAYAPRYQRVAGDRFLPGAVSVVGEVDGGSATDFGVLAGPSLWDDEPLPANDVELFIDVLERAWAAFDAAADAASAELRKGPRGGGRDRDQIVAHVRNAERAYGAKASVRMPVATPWPVGRAALVAALRTGCPGPAWPPRYLARRVSWHVLDHLWEIEDRSDRS